MELNLDVLMYRTLMITLLLFWFITGQANEINYQHKQLKKELLKTWEVELSALVELKEASSQLINEGKFYKVVKDAEIIGYVYVGRIISCRQGGCARDKTTTYSGNYEYFDAFFLYNADKNMERVKVFNYRATHGQEVCSKGWLKQFIGFNSEEPLVVGKSIDGLSGATISAHALTDEVNYVTQLLISTN
jgi:Na+-translocating ferredoxin:NAD+ oxidoreductase RnfG subunit